MPGLLGLTLADHALPDRVSGPEPTCWPLSCSAYVATRTVLSVGSMPTVKWIARPSVTFCGGGSYTEMTEPETTENVTCACPVDVPSLTVTTSV